MNTLLLVIMCLLQLACTSVRAQALLTPASDQHIFKTEQHTIVQTQQSLVSNGQTNQQEPDSAQQKLTDIARRMEFGLPIERKVLMELLANKQADVNALIKTPGNMGKTLLHFAAEYGYVQEAKLIIAHRSDVDVDKESFDGKRAIELAQQQGNAELVKLFVQAGAGEVEQEDEEEEAGEGGGDGGGDDDDAEDRQENDDATPVVAGDDAGESEASDESEQVKELQERKIVQEKGTQKKEKKKSLVNEWMQAILNSIKDGGDQEVKPEVVRDDVSVEKKQTVEKEQTSRLERFKNITVEIVAPKVEEGVPQTKVQESGPERASRKVIVPPIVQTPAAERVPDVDAATLQRARQAELVG
ncbi:MAG: ankyrin repeat domain-containing protein [Epsilonproteobacteria bacterium]|nr:ankyrin repeat domain-containing protein [Campylobacterota bacterium]